MSKPGERLWFYGTRVAALTLPLLFIALAVGVAVLRKLLDWPGYELDQTVLIGIFVLSLIPLVLAVMDAMVERRGAVKLPWLEIDFSHVAAVAVPAVTVPVNIGVPGQPVTDSDTGRILDALRSASASEIVVVDLEDGHAWWETRLLILLAGAVRMRRPELMVFLGTEGGVNGRFQGWARTDALFRVLLHADPRYTFSYHTAMAIAHSWAQVEPVAGQLPPAPVGAPPSVVGLGWMAFDPATGLPNPLAPEQMLAIELGNRVEMQGPPREITLRRLEELFRAVLQTDAIDETWPSERQLAAFFDASAPYVAVTGNGRYVRLLPRDAALGAIVRSLAMPSKET